MKTETSANRLIKEKSPYLLQHAYNPVDWYAWGPEAFAAAKKSDKPIFLSIGYSTCHWCHVMEHESFEDKEVAQLMNEAFISIKVDREERPDIDSLYMTVAQLLTGRGGWPLTIIMTPEKKPFFAATYIPKYSRQGAMGMMDLIPAVKETWETKRAEIDSATVEILAALTSAHETDLSGDARGEKELDLAYEQLESSYEPEFGGFGSAPKFPTPHNLSFLLRYWKRTGNDKALEMVEKTLKQMRRGGIYDHVGFGFHRYSTDREWLVPHFEKMLYDQAMISFVYLEAFQITGKREYAQTAEEIFEYVLRDMNSPEGGFYSAEDADSEGEEGKFYLWKKEEIEKILGSEATAVIDLFNVSTEGNFHEEATGIRHGTNILHLKESLSERADPKLRELWDISRKRLFEVREKRIHPLKDDKVLTDWNGLMIASLARAAQVLGHVEYREAARRAADFILSEMKSNDHRLLHRYREGEAAIKGKLNDYTFFIAGLIELYQATFEQTYLAAAVQIAESMIEYFWDDEDGGFYLTPDDGEKLLSRPKDTYDGAIPSGNSVAMEVLVKLSRLTGRTELEERAVALSRSFSKTLVKYPSVHTYMMGAVDFLVGPSFEIVLVGDPEAEDTQRLYRELMSRYLPNKVVLFKPADDRRHPISDLAPYTESMTSLDGKATVYVCTNFACELPTTDVKKMVSLLDAD